MDNWFKTRANKSKWGKNPSPTNGVGTTKYWQVNEWSYTIILYTNIYSKWKNYLNIRAKTAKLIKKHMDKSS